MSVDGKKVIVFASAVVGIAMCGLAGLSLYAKSSTAKQLASLEVRLQDARQELSAAEERGSEPVTEQVEPALRLLSTPDVVGTLRELNALSEKAGVRLDNQKALKAGSAGKQPFVVSGRGRPEQVCGFLAAIENSERLMVIETGRVFPATGDDIAFEFGLATYHEGYRQ